MGVRITLMQLQLTVDMQLMSIEDVPVPSLSLFAE